MLRDEEAYGYAVFVAVCNALPIEEVTELSFDTLLLEIKEATQVDLMDTLNGLKLQAVLGYIKEPGLFYEDLVSFIDICNVLSGADIDPDVFDPADPFEMSWAIAETRIIDPPDIAEPWTQEIREYMGLTLTHFGFMRPPANMTMAIMPRGVNPALMLADQPDLVTASVELQDSLAREVNESVQEQLKELAQQLAPFQRPELEHQEGQRGLR